MKKTISNIIITLLVIALISSGGYLGFYLLQNGKSTYEDKKVSKLIVADTNCDDFSDLPAGMLHKFADAYRTNNKLVGWLSLNSFDSPVVQGKDNSEYLKKSFYNKYSFYGTPFMDFDDSSSPLSQNTIIYGHNMGDSKKFGYIKKYYKNEKNKNSNIYFSNLYNEYAGELVACLYTSSMTNDEYSYLIKTFFNENEFERYKEILNKYKIYDTDIDINLNDNVLTLYTCAYGHEDEKFLMIFKLK